MIIIWGWRALKKVIATGEFFCPQCQGDTGYRHVAPRMWFTIFFIPIIPLKHLDPYVECTRCGGAFVEAVLAAPTAAVFEHQLGLAQRAMVAHLAGLAPVVTGEVADVAVQALSSAAGVQPGYDRGRLDADVRAFASPDVMAEHLRPLAGLMNPEGREELVRRAVVLAEQVPGRPEAVTAAVDRIAAELAITPAHLAGIRATALRGTGTPPDADR